MDKQNYEAAVIFTPVLSDQQLKDAVATYRELITANQGEIVNEDSWGLTKLAYPIQKKNSGFYHIYEFKAPTDMVKTLDIAYRRDERVMRFLTLRLDKHALVYNERRKNGEFKKKAKKEKEAV